MCYIKKQDEKAINKITDLNNFPQYYEIIMYCQHSRNNVFVVYYGLEFGQKRTLKNKPINRAQK